VKSCLAPADIDRVVALTGRLEQLDTTRELIDIAARPVMGDG
jgi:hypothetical protein